MHTTPAHYSIKQGLRLIIAMMCLQQVITHFKSVFKKPVPRRP
jgi:hypothetical protein